MEFATMSERHRLSVSQCQRGGALLLVTCSDVKREFEEQETFFALKWGSLQRKITTENFHDLTLRLRHFFGWFLLDGYSRVVRLVLIVSRWTRI